MDAGGLAQMSYNNFQTIGVPGSGFASRGKGAHIKRLSFEPTAASDPANNGAPTPRTSRSHLLAGLRTAPKTTTGAHFPPSAPPTQLQHQGLDNSMYAESKNNSRSGYGAPKTSIGSSFSTQQQQQQPSYNRQMYALPEQVLAPPEIHIDEHGQEQMDPNLYAQLVATNMYLAEQQQRLQQQLINVQAAAQQFQGMSLGHMGRQMPQQFATPPVTPGAGMYQQQAKQNGQPIITPVPGGQPGLYSVYNPMTGQQTYYIDQGAQQAYADSHDIYTDSGRHRSRLHAPLPGVAAEQQRHHSQHLAPKEERLASSGSYTAPSTIGQRFPPWTQEVVQPGQCSHRYAPTPMTGTFGPGQGRAGEHPIRQPRGPPSLDELRAKPTSKFEGSKNFATRQRRNAVHNLVRAGLERRRGPGSGSAGSISPISETGELTFATSSGEESDSGRSGSGSLSGRPSLGSLRTSIHGAIGSDRPSSRQKNHSDGGDEGPAICSFAAAFKHGGKKPETEQARLKAPMLVLSSVEKRKSSVF
ncbi:hypothetical protein VE04_10326 [Pseudogymnoascus sp. 24MN13]|nr:hypothetical protein VE04_10326 [Pseudogymnoascus sp. 24MN13]